MIWCIIVSSRETNSYSCHIITRHDGRVKWNSSVFRNNINLIWEPFWPMLRGKWYRGPSRSYRRRLITIHMSWCDVWGETAKETFVSSEETFILIIHSLSKALLANVNMELSGPYQHNHALGSEHSQWYYNMKQIWLCNISGLAVSCSTMIFLCMSEYLSSPVVILCVLELTVCGSQENTGNTQGTKWHIIQVYRMMRMNQLFS